MRATTPTQRRVCVEAGELRCTLMDALLRGGLTPIQAVSALGGGVHLGVATAITDPRERLDVPPCIRVRRETARSTAQGMGAARAHTHHHGRRDRVTRSHRPLPRVCAARTAEGCGCGDGGHRLCGGRYHRHHTGHAASRWRLRTIHDSRGACHTPMPGTRSVCVVSVGCIGMPASSTRSSASASREGRSAIFALDGT